MTGRGCPLGTETVKKGYVFVKVAKSPTRRGTHDNWKAKHKIVWEEHYGDVPEGCVIFFADRDRTNFDPENLVAVPKRLVGMMNENADERGMVWHDRESLLACMAYAELTMAINDAEETVPCSVCGTEFRVDRRRGNMKVCPDCLKAGFRARREPGSVGGRGMATCKRCGAEFERDRRGQVNCPDCIRLERKRPSRAKYLGKEVACAT